MLFLYRLLLDHNYGMKLETYVGPVPKYYAAVSLTSELKFGTLISVLPWGKFTPILVFLRFFQFLEIQAWCRTGKNANAAYDGRPHNYSRTPWLAHVVFELESYLVVQLAEHAGIIDGEVTGNQLEHVVVEMTWHRRHRGTLDTTLQVLVVHLTKVATNSAIVGWKTWGKERVGCYNFPSDREDYGC